MNLKVKKFLQATFDIDQSLFKTFLTLFTDPRSVVAQPNVFMKPWKYATYVVSISCLIYWFAIRILDDPNEHQILWAVPKRLLNLEIGHTNFYETTQPLKRLILGVAGFYIGFLVVAFKERKRLVTISLYLIGTSVFTAFIFQALGMFILREGIWTNIDALIGVLTHLAYLSYAGVRVLQPQQWAGFLKVPVVFAIYYLIYPPSSTFLVHTLYYDVLSRGHRLYQINPEDVGSIRYDRIKALPENTTEADAQIRLQLERGATFGNLSHHSFGRIISVDSIWVAIEYVGSAGEVSKVFASSFSPTFERMWSTQIFEKINRYSPDPHRIYLKANSTGEAIVACYRLPNDINSTLQLSSIVLSSGTVKYSKALDFKVDDFEVEDIELDSSNIYLCGIAQEPFKERGLGMLVRVDLASGDMRRIRFIGEPSFASWTTFDEMKVSKSRIELTVKHDYKRFIYFRRDERSTLTIDKAILN